MSWLDVRPTLLPCPVCLTQLLEHTGSLSTCVVRGAVTQFQPCNGHSCTTTGVQNFTEGCNGVAGFISGATEGQLPICTARGSVSQFTPCPTGTSTCSVYPGFPEACAKIGTTTGRRCAGSPISSFVVSRVLRLGCVLGVCTLCACVWSGATQSICMGFALVRNSSISPCVVARAAAGNRAFHDSRRISVVAPQAGSLTVTLTAASRSAPRLGRSHSCTRASGRARAASRRCVHVHSCGDLTWDWSVQGKVHCALPCLL